MVCAGLQKGGTGTCFLVFSRNSTKCCCIRGPRRFYKLKAFLKTGKHSLSSINNRLFPLIKRKLRLTTQTLIFKLVKCCILDFCSLLLSVYNKQIQPSFKSKKYPELWAVFSLSHHPGRPGLQSTRGSISFAVITVQELPGSEESGLWFRACKNSDSGEIPSTLY